MSHWVWYLREAKHRKVACLSGEPLALWAGERPLGSTAATYTSLVGVREEGWVQLLDTGCTSEPQRVAGSLGFGDGGEICVESFKGKHLSHSLPLAGDHWQTEG